MKNNQLMDSSNSTLNEPANAAVPQILRTPITVPAALRADGEADEDVVGRAVFETRTEDVVEALVYVRYSEDTVCGP